MRECCQVSELGGDRPGQLIVGQVQVRECCQVPELGGDRPGQLIVEQVQIRECCQVPELGGDRPGQLIAVQIQRVDMAGCTRDTVPGAGVRVGEPSGVVRPRRAGCRVVEFDEGGTLGFGDAGLGAADGAAVVPVRVEAVQPVGEIGGGSGEDPVCPTSRGW